MRRFTRIYNEYITLDNFIDLTENKYIESTKHQIKDDLMRRSKRPMRNKYKVRDMVCSIGSLLPNIMYTSQIPVAALEYTGSSKLRNAQEIFYKLTEVKTIYKYKRAKYDTSKR